jgi:hypothetical protein
VGWKNSLSALLRGVQFYCGGGYHARTDGEDGFCAGLL